MGRFPGGQPRPQPVRTCVGCRVRAAKSELLRLVVVEDGPGRSVRPDPHGKALGRGAHLHPRTACLDLAERRRAFQRALRTEGPLELAAIRQWVTQHGHQAPAAPNNATEEERSSSS